VQPSRIYEAVRVRSGVYGACHDLAGLRQQRWRRGGAAAPTTSIPAASAEFSVLKRTSFGAHRDELARAISAFATDLGAQMQRVTLLVYNEFGRRLASNASNGVDHGAGGLAYLIGGGVKGKQVAGRGWRIRISKWARI
jgi:hypothetical protein